MTCYNKSTFSCICFWLNKKIQFRNGRWYAMEKFDTSSKCLTYDFQGESGKEMFVEQRSTLTGLARLSFDNKAIYKGRLVVPKSSEPANMIVRFPLSKLNNFFIFDIVQLSLPWFRLTVFEIEMINLQPFWSTPFEDAKQINSCWKFQNSNAIK